jgi:serpin B
MRRHTLLIIALLTLIQIGCSRSKQKNEQALVPIDPEEQALLVDKLAAGTNDFSLSLFKQLEEDTNVVISPLGASIALAMAYAGAEGKTEAEIAKVLKYSVPQAKLPQIYQELESRVHGAENEDFQLHIANAVWGQQGRDFNEPFADTLERHYGAQSYEVDFEEPTKAAAMINGWVVQQTNGRIRKLVKEEDLESAMFVLTNAIYFDAKWAVKFPKSNTRDRGFTLTSGEEVQVPTMEVQLILERARVGDTTFVFLPYKGGTTEMVIIHPDDLEAFESQKLSSKTIESAMKQMKPRSLVFSMPKFAFDSDHSMKESLKSMGMKRSFSSGAEFPGIFDDPTRIAEVIQKTRIEVNEEQTVAAAATAAWGTAISMVKEPPPKLQIDSPFLFLIRDTETGLILFIGRVTNPEKALK